MKKIIVIVGMLAFCAVSYPAKHRIDPRIPKEHRLSVFTGDETIPLDALNRYSIAEPPPMIDTIGLVRRVGRSWYDCQHNGTIGRMLALDSAAGNVHIAYMRGIDSLATNRHVFYNLYSTQFDSFLFGSDGMQVPPLTVSRSGFTTLGLDAASHIPFIAFHEINPRVPNGLLSSNVYHDIEPFAGAFIADAPMSLVSIGGTHIEAIWPKIAVGRNGVIHVVSTESPTVTTDPMRQFYHRGLFDAMQSTVTWSAPLQIPGISEVIGAEVAASRVSNRAAIAWCRPNTEDDATIPVPSNNQLYNNVAYLLSVDGETWNTNDIRHIARWRQPNTALLPDTAAANGDTYRAYTDVSLLFSQTDELHAAFTANEFFRWDVHQIDTATGSTIHNDTAVYVFSQIFHWRENRPLALVRAADGGNFWSDIYANPGAWNSNVMRPSLCQSLNGNLYIAFAAHHDPRDSTLAMDVSSASQANWDIFITVSTDNGNHWAYGTNITATRSPNALRGACRSENWPSANPRVDNYIHLVYMTDFDAGWVFQTAPQEGGWTYNDFNYHRVPATAIPATPLLPDLIISAPEPVERSALPTAFRIERNYPNPFNPTTDIVFSLDRPLNIRLAVYDIAGREVASLTKGKLNAGAYKVTFDARGLPSGVYFARMSADGLVSSRKLTLLK